MREGQEADFHDKIQTKELLGMSSSKVSVIIPTLNRPDFLIEAAQSVLNQSTPAFEIIVINDGSMADYKDKIQEIELLSSRISIFHLPTNKGVAAARNFGIEKASGDYILFLDDDDLLHPSMLESCLTYFKKNKDVDVVSCWSETLMSTNPLGAPLKDENHRLKRYFLNNLFLPKRINNAKLEKHPISEILRSIPQINSCLAKRKSIGNVRFAEDLMVGEDVYFWLSLAARGCRFKSNPKAYAIVRRHSDNHLFREGNTNLHLAFLYKVLSSGMLTKREDLFICHSQIFKRIYKRNTQDKNEYLKFMVKSPDLLIKYFFWYSLEWLKERQKIIKLFSKNTS